MALIDLDDVALTFRIRERNRISLKEYVIRRLWHGQEINPTVEVHALNGVNLRAEDGDRIGIIGHNGAGKSTLLNVIAGIYPPTQGERTVEGRICSLFNIALGFELEASGWENIAHRAYLQGETPRTLKPKLSDIADFTELGHFLNVPVRYYSAGMMVRLAFAIATSAEPEVLLIDEVLGVGDLSFQTKARARMMEMMKSARVMVVVSHELATIRSLCNRAIWMEHGTVRLAGDVDEVIDAYVEELSPGTTAPPGKTLPEVKAALASPAA